MDRLLRELAPEALGAVTRRYGHFELAEDAVQEALLAASAQWPSAGRPENPRAWLVAVAARRLVDLLRSDRARRLREQALAQTSLPDQREGPASVDGLSATLVHNGDDTLTLLFLCCHPALSRASQVALTLRAVGGLTTREIARAFLVSEETMTRRITRAKRSISESRLPFVLPSQDERPTRLRAVLHVLYLVFNEGYLATSGDSLQRTGLSGEAIRLGRLLARLMPDDAEVAGLLALMLLTDARRAARTAPDGSPVPMAEQARELWDRSEIAEGAKLLTTAMKRGPVGPFQLQAAIAALHDEADDAESTDWRQILALYDALLDFGDTAVVRLNRAVAIAMVYGPVPALAELDGLSQAPELRNDHRLGSVRGHLLEQAGDTAAARDCYLAAARQAVSLPLRRYLNERAARLA